MGARDQNAAPGLPDNVDAAEKSPPTAPIVAPLPLSVLNGFTWPEPPERIDWTADAEGSGRTLTLQLAERIGYNPADIELLLLFTGSSPVEAGSSNGGSGKNHTQKDGEELRRITDEETLATQGVPSGATVRIVRRHRTMPACARDAFGVVPGASRGVSASFLEQLREPLVLRLLDELRVGGHVVGAERLEAPPRGPRLLDLDAVRVELQLGLAAARAPRGLGAPRAARLHDLVAPRDELAAEAALLAPPPLLVVW